MAPEIDLLSPAAFAGDQPYEWFEWLRDEAPVYRHAEPQGPGFWVVTRHEDVRTIGRDPATFSSEPTIMIDDPSADSQGVLGDHKMMLMADPPVHTRMRRLVSRDFTPRAAAELRPRVEQLATQIVDAVIERGECDLVSDLAGEMPSFVIADVLGLPLEEGRALYHLTEALHSSADAVEPGVQGAAFAEMFQRSQQVWADKRANPADDLATMLAHAEIDGEPVDAIDFFLWFMLLVDAGGDTTRNLVGGGMWALWQHPEQFERLRADPQRMMPTAIEELLRWVTPVIYMRRTVTQPTSLSGVDLAVGDKVVVYYGAANRDPRAFEDPDVLDLGRTPNPHVAFGGGGPHFCLGAHLARIEIDALLSEMLRRLDDLTLAGPATWMPSVFIYGPTSLPVTFTPGRRVGGSATSVV